eukprot:TRINITY_DN10485_c0_g1_i1.p1 TRINITY_DN10485_c0_g1~~TRINITY_DN10485_c0_g1_i1.p1  ORF type:complete len:600 (+),score=59.74 TRINITY_DN10485_c0_g1_i1:65-1864(+)
MATRMQSLFPMGPGGVCHPLNVHSFDLNHPACNGLYDTRHRTWDIFDGWETRVHAMAQLAKNVWNCSTVQQCGLAQLFWTMAQHVSPGHNKRPVSDDSFRSALFDRIRRRMMRDQQRYLHQLLRKRRTELKSADREPPRRRATRPDSVTLGMHSDRASAVGPWRGQIELWKAYANVHGLHWVLDTKEYFDGEIFARYLGMYWATSSAAERGFWKRHDYLAPTHAGLEAIMRNPSSVNLLNQELLDSLVVFTQPPMMWDSLEALAEAVPLNEWTVWMDFDLTLSPCCFDTFSFVELIDGREDGSRADDLPHVIIRDSPREDYHHHCANAGFFVVRNSSVGRLFVELARQKRRWPALHYGYQGALAEALLELLGFEHAIATASSSDGDANLVRSEYGSQCLPFMALGNEHGHASYANYCMCWKHQLRKLAGSRDMRTSRWVRFLDPREGVEPGLLFASLLIYKQKDRGVGFLPLTTWSMEQHRAYADAWLPPDDEFGGPCGMLPLMVHWASLPYRPRLIYEFMSKRFPGELPLALLTNGSADDLATAYKAAAAVGRAKWEHSKAIFPGLFSSGGACSLSTARMWDRGGFTKNGRSTVEEHR